MTAEVENLSTAPRFHLQSQAQKVDANRIVTVFTGHGDVLKGALSMNGDVGGALGGTGAFTDALTGSVRFDVTPGELRGVSLLQATFGSFHAGGLGGLVGSLALGGLGGLFGPGLERYYGDTFDTLAGTLQLAQGLARTDDLRLVTSSYEARIAGVIRLDDLGLDAHGRLILGQELSQTLAHRVGRTLGSATRLEIPLPSIRGTLTNPKVKADWKFFLSALTSTVPGSNQVDQLLRGLGGGLLGK